MDYETVLKIVRANVPHGDHYTIAAQILKGIHDAKAGPKVIAIKQDAKRKRRTKEEMAAASTANAPIQLHQDAAE